MNYRYEFLTMRGESLATIETTGALPIVLGMFLDFLVDGLPHMLEVKKMTIHFRDSDEIVIDVECVASV